MAGIGAWDVPAGTTSNLKIKRKDWKSIGGAIEHKNRPEAIYVTISTWVKPKLSITKAQSTATNEPEELVVKIAEDFEKEVRRSARKFSSYFDSKFFDGGSIIFTMDYAPSQAKPGKKQFLEVEINIDTVNEIGMDNEPAPNPSTGRVEMYSYKDMEKALTKAIDKILDTEVFSMNKAIVNFSKTKGGK